MASNFPTSLDVEAGVGGSTTPSPATTDTTDTPSHAGLHQKVGDAVVAVETKVGTGSSTAASGAALMGTGSGTSSWQTAPTFAGAVSAASFAGPLTGAVTGDLTGNADTVTVADAAGDATTFPLLGTAATGSLAPATDAGLSYNATTNALTAGSFVGALTGNASTATALATARTIDITGDITATAVAFDGTANIAISAAVNNDSHSHTGTTLSAIPASDITAGTFGTGDYAFPSDITVTAQVKAGDGTVLLPGVAFASDLDTGFRLAAAGALNVVTAGADRLRIDGSTVRPLTDNSLSSGSSGARWTAVYAVNGTIQTSDERLKVWRGESLGLDFVLSLNPRSFVWADDDSGTVREGLSAQQVRNELTKAGRPDRVGMWAEAEGEDGAEGLNYAEFIPAIIRSIQDLYSRTVPA